jgi:hypothetical protein
MKRISIGFGTMSLCVLLSLPISALALPIAAPGAPANAHPEIMAALRSLHQARFHLNGAATVYGGHRVKAEQLTDQAIRELHAAVDYANTKHVERLPGAPPMSKGQRKPQKGYPYIHDAINELTAARSHLQKAASDFGGHKLNAIKLINQAIGECQASLRYVHAK